MGKNNLLPEHAIEEPRFYLRVREHHNEYKFERNSCFWFDQWQCFSKFKSQSSRLCLMTGSKSKENFNLRVLKIKSEINIQKKKIFFLNELSLIDAKERKNGFRFLLARLNY